MENKPNLPRHVGLITDGNRRWAKENNLPSFEGHRQGFESVKNIVKTAEKIGIEIFTFWCFSTENWGRPADEIDYLMNLFERSLEDFKDIAGQNMRFRVVGQKWRFRQSIQEKIDEIEIATANNKGMTVNAAMSYGGRDEITQAVKNIVKKGISSEDINEKIISENLWLPDIDLIIRTGGEQRLSGFLSWQSAYAELFFVKKYLPAFTPEDFKEIIAEYGRRQRRFGK